MDVRPIPESSGEEVNFSLESSPDLGKQFRDSYYLVKYYLFHSFFVYILVQSPPPSPLKRLLSNRNIKQIHFDQFCCSFAVVFFQFNLL